MAARGIVAVAMVAVAALLASAATTASTAAAADDIVASPACCTFAPGPFRQGLGETSNLVIPADADAPHNVESIALGPDGKSLFASTANVAGTSTPVEGTQYLGAGTYPFICSLHGSGMSGELVVDGASGSAVPRPQLRFAFPRRKLKQVRRKGVRLRVRGATAVPEATVEVRLAGKGVIGRRAGIALAAGQTRVLTFRLSKKLRKAIRKRRAIRVKASATVAFGRPAAAARRFR